MSDLRCKNVKQLQDEKQSCEKYIAQLRSRLNGQLTRLEWIDNYIFEKTPQEMSIQDIEQKLGHRIIIK